MPISVIVTTAATAMNIRLEEETLELIEEAVSGVVMPGVVTDGFILSGVVVLGFVIWGFANCDSGSAWYVESRLL